MIMKLIAAYPDVSFQDRFSIVGRDEPYRGESFLVDEVVFNCGFPRETGSNDCDEHGKNVLVRFGSP